MHFRSHLTDDLAPQVSTDLQTVAGAAGGTATFSSLAFAFALVSVLPPQPSLL